jgi:hypothetical protein
MVFITSVTASGAGAIDLTSGFTSAYDQYMLVGQNISTFNNSVFIYMRFYIDGNLISSGVYGSNVAYLGSGAWGGAVGGSGGNAQGILVGNGASYTAATNLNFVGYINQPSNTANFKQFYWTGSFGYGAGATYPYLGAVGVGLTDALTGISFYPSAGTISGTIRLYGIKNS